MEKEPLVSVVIPTYNRGKKLRLCLEAIEKQDYPKKKYEIIIVNDGSKDNTIEEIKKIAKKSKCKIKAINQKNSGPAVARNTGIKNSKGKVIFFVDDDQVMYPDFIKKNLRHYTSDKIGGVGSAAPPRIMSWVDKYYTARYLDESLVINTIKDYKSGKGLPTAACSYRKDVLDKVGYFDETFPLAAGEDVELSRRVLKAGFCLVKDPEIVGEHLRSDNFKSVFRLKFKRMSGAVVDSNKKGFKEKSPYRISRVFEQWKKFSYYKKRVLKEKITFLDKIKFVYLTLALAVAGILGQIYYKIKQK